MSYPNRRSVGIFAAVTFSLLAGLLIGSLGINSLTAQAQPPFQVIDGPPFVANPRPINLQRAIDRLEAKLDQLGRVVDQNSETIVQVNQGVEKLEGKLDRKPGNGSDLGDAVDAIEAKLDRLGRFLFEHVVDTTEALNSLEAKLDRADGSE